MKRKWMEYRITDADRKTIPESYSLETRYLGYSEEDRSLSYARYFKDRTLPIQPHVMEAITGGPVSSERGLRLCEAPAALSRKGYLPCENGYTINEDGLIVVAVRTDMPRVTGEMWDWWFGWHGVETARYKLWHPDAHLFTAMGEDRSATPGLTDRQRYVGNVSYVDEYIGMTASPLAIRFIDPETWGFPPSKPGDTTIVARVGLSTVPFCFSWLIHQVRATPDGSEMRSRFFVNDASVLRLPARSVASITGKVLSNPIARGAARLAAGRITHQDVRSFGPDLLNHCAAEMNHLATFLPELHEEYSAQ